MYSCCVSERVPRKRLADARSMTDMAWASHRPLLNFRNLQSDREPSPKWISCHIFHLCFIRVYILRSRPGLISWRRNGVALVTEVIEAQIDAWYTTSQRATAIVQHGLLQAIAEYLITSASSIHWPSDKLTYRDLHLPVVFLMRAFLRFRRDKLETHSVVGYLVRRAIQIGFFATLWAWRHGFSC